MIGCQEIHWHIMCPSHLYNVMPTYSISQEICTRFCFAVLCCVYTLTDFPISIRLTSLALWQSHDCPSASKATLMNMDRYFMWIHYERFHNHNKAKHNKTVCIFLGIYCIGDGLGHMYTVYECWPYFVLFSFGVVISPVFVNLCDLYADIPHSYLSSMVAACQWRTAGDIDKNEKSSHVD